MIDAAPTVPIESRTSRLARRALRAFAVALVTPGAFAVVPWDADKRIGLLYGPHLALLESTSH